ncbi:MAG: DnaB-like helicase N-terminal domain-containing protein, partial [Oscillospiraceae bacterium]
LSIFSENNKLYEKGSERSKNIKYALCEDKIICALIKNPDFYESIHSKIMPKDFVTSKNKSILEAVYTLLEKNMQPDLIHLSSMLSEELTGIVSFLLSNCFGTRFSMNEIDDYISNLLEYKTHKTQEEVASMNDDEYRLFFEKIKK